jgi:hypothetical protein
MGLSNQLPSSRLAQSGVCTSVTRPASPYEGQMIYETDTDYFWDEIGYKCECFTLEEVIEGIGDIYEDLNDSDKERIVEIHKNNFVE